MMYGRWETVWWAQPTKNLKQERMECVYSTCTCRSAKQVPSEQVQLYPPHWVSVDQVPAEEQKNKIREQKSKDATDKVCTMGNQNCGAATKAEKRQNVKLMDLIGS